MTDQYKTHITDRIKDDLNRWIEELKQKHPDLLLTRQWKLLWPKGFAEGQNVVPVITNSKQGKYLVGEVQFVLPASLDLDLETVELCLRDEPFQEKSMKSHAAPVPLDEPLDLLNDLILGVNGFLQTLNIASPQHPAINPFSSPGATSPAPISPVNIRGISGSATFGRHEDSSEVEEVKSRMLRSPSLPEWYATISNQKVADELLGRLAEGFLHYQRQRGQSVTLDEYFKRYTEYLLNENKVHSYCKYKGKPVHMNSDGLCPEHYCSKKPYNTPCPQATLRFGAPSLD